jgi:hypothetical protein
VIVAAGSSGESIGTRRVFLKGSEPDRDPPVTRVHDAWRGVCQPFYAVVAKGEKLFTTEFSGIGSGPAEKKDLLVLAQQAVDRVH